MKRVKLPSQAVDQTKVYHVSSDRNRASITKHGLIPGGDMAKDEQGAPKQHGESNWVFTTPSAAMTMSAGNWGSSGKNDVWEIDHPHSDLESDTHPGWESLPSIQESRAVIKGKVDPSRMRLFNDRRTK